MRNIRRNLRRAVSLGTVLCIVGASVAVSAQHRVHIGRPLVAALENRFQRTVVDDWRRITGLVVAGGSHVRIQEAVRLARKHPHLKLVLTGPGEHEVKAALTAEGVSRERIILEPRAVNTYENAVLSRRLVAPKPGERWLLVTSAYHMPRALGAFYRAAFFVEPWPVEDEVRGAEALAATARHEWLGLVAYWLRGRSIAIFPHDRDLKAARLRG